MASLSARLQKPEYVYRPMQILRRICNTLGGKPSGATTVMLPWGLPIQVRPTELIGASIWRMGLYDIAVTEAIWRLLDKGEHAVDVGTNIGHMSSVMAARVGPQGVVDSFEPHPAILATLRHNVCQWASYPSVAKVTVHPMALSASAGRALLNIADDFETNQGGSFLGDASQPPSSQNTKSRSVEVETARLDHVLPQATPIALLKLDVEGHEMSVLQGATSLLERKAIRDVIFEEHKPYPTEVSTLLENYGYTIFRMEKRFSGLDVYLPNEHPATHNPYDPPNYLATLDAARSSQRFATRGWSCLKSRGH